MIECLIVDDEQSAIEVLKHHINKVSYLNLVATTRSALEAIEILSTSKIDLIFVDINMPEMSGIDLIKSLEVRYQIIITTAHPQYALEGYELDITDYLLKPVSLPRFVKAVQKASGNIAAHAARQTTDLDVHDDHVYVRAETKGKLIKIMFSEIDFIESVRNYIAIHRNGEKIMVLMGLKAMEERLPFPKFLRVHRSYIVNTEKIKAVTSGHLSLRVQELNIPFGDSYKEFFLQVIKDKLL